MNNRAPGLFLIAAILAVWQFSSAMNLVDAVALPPISTIFQSWVASIKDGELVRQLAPSLGRIFSGFGLAVLVGVPMGLLMGTVTFVYRLLEPLTEFIRPIPSSAYIPVAILFLGIGDEMKIFVIFLACLFPSLLNSYSGVRGVDPVLVDTGRTFGLTRFKMLRDIIRRRPCLMFSPACA